MANKNIFNTIQVASPKSNFFDLTHDVKLTLDMGELVPVMVLDTVPGDRFKVSHETLIRFAPLIAPVMHRMDVTLHTFFVPHRIVYSDWEAFITGNNLAGPDIGPDPVWPYTAFNSGKYSTSKLWDYLGFPDPGAEVENVSVLPLASYQCIYNEYYRDQNLTEQIEYQVISGSQDNAFLYPLRQRAWEHDYFTSALPWAQKGSAVDIPLGDVSLDPNWHVSGLNNPVFVNGPTNVAPSFQASVAGEFEQSGDPAGFISADGNLAAYDPRGSLTVQSTTINDLRRAFRLQEWLEKNARGGTRYTESILVHFGVKSSDARLQRPEYITGTKTPVVVSEVLNTTGTDDLPQGNMSGHAIAVSGGKQGYFYCEEHGYIITIMSILPKTAYQQGLPRMYSRQDRLDYFWPEFANIGEQEILNKEVYIQHTNPNGTFGYVPRYSEYKYTASRVAGDFKTSLNFWHLGRIFTADPALNYDFVTSNPTKRIFAVVDPNVDSLYAHVLNRVGAFRKMPKYGTPSF